jgi:hypothetical protein
MKEKVGPDGNPILKPKMGPDGKPLKKPSGGSGPASATSSPVPSGR